MNITKFYWFFHGISKVVKIFPSSESQSWGLHNSKFHCWVYERWGCKQITWGYYRAIFHGVSMGTRTHTHTYIYTCMYIYIYMYVRTYLPTYITFHSMPFHYITLHTYIYIYIYDRDLGIIANIL